MDVSISIANWNHATLLDACLRSIFTTPLTIKYEVIVVDNASADCSLTVVQERFPQVHLISNSDNLGFAKAHNQALSISRGRYFLALNNDATVWPDTIPILVQLMDQHPLVGICGCPDFRQTTLWTPNSGARRQFPTVIKTGLGNLRYVLFPSLQVARYWPFPDTRFFSGDDCRECEDQEVAWVIGALLFCRRKMLEDLGGFDEQFFLFEEEVDLCRRAWLAGWKIFFTKSTSYLHQGGRSSALRTDIEKIRGESGVKYFKKHHGVLAATIFWVQHCVLRRGLLQWRRQVGRIITRLRKA